MDWIVESAEGELLGMDLTKEEAVTMAKLLSETRDEPVSVQNIVKGEEIVILPSGSNDHHQ